jgi:hypothetical protein
MSPERVLEVQELHDDAFEKVTTHHATIIETKTVKSFHPKHWQEEVTHNGAYKRLRHAQTSLP